MKKIIVAFLAVLFVGSAFAANEVRIEQKFGQSGRVKRNITPVNQGVVGFDQNGKVVSKQFGFSYNGGAVTQLTSKSTGVTLSKYSGAVTMHNAALAAAAKVSFVVTNTLVVATDVPVVSVASGGTASAYRANVTAVGAGVFTITVENITAGSLSEAPVVNFVIIHGVTS